ncbi:T9SS type A sorting domain-containing protein [Maribellus comscasis]|nr:T9SS type A sorting domain-containing protein [Maribellus comscasis]
MRIILMILAGIFLFEYSSVGQISQGGKPLEFLGLKSAKIPVERMPDLDNDILLKQAIGEYNNSVQLKPFRFATSFEVNYTVANSGVWTTANDGTQIWRLNIVSEGAKSLNLIFSSFNLPAGARLFLFNENTKHVLGAFTSFNNKSTGKFAVMPVAGDEITVQYEIPAGYDPDETFAVSRVNHDFAGIIKSDDRRPFYPTVAGSCNIDVNCEIGKDWSDVRDAACRLIVNGTEVCSGTLINNTAEDETPYVISAAHCYDRWEYAETTIYAFNYESPYCSPLDGDPSNSVSGAIMKARFDSLDFALAEMSLVPPPEYRPYYVGWDKSGTMSDTAVAIHHPWGDIKKISFDYDKPGFSDFNSHYVDNAFIKVGRWDEGVTESGSSGGGLFNRNKNLIGTLTGGSAKCEKPIDDYFARFDMAWDYKSDITKQLKHWLDPEETGASYVYGKRFYQEEELCGAFTNLTDEDEHQLRTITVDGDFSGYWGGTNDAGITEVVEKFSIDGAETIQGVSLGVGRVYDTGSGGKVVIKVYNGTNLPGQLLYSQSVDLDFFVEDAMNYIGFESDVQPDGNFYIGFELENMSSTDTFAVYQSVRETDSVNFFYFKSGSMWYNFANINPDGYSASNVFEVVACNIYGESDEPHVVDDPLQIAVYPNPTNSYFTLETGTEISLKNISVFNLLGQQVEVIYSNQQEKKIRIDLWGNVAGVYFVRFNNGKKFVTKKISYFPW